jgi:hypothetical protein
MSKTTFYTLLGLGVVVVFCVCVCNLDWPLQVPFFVLVGWVIYPFRILRDHEVPWYAFGILAAILAVTTVTVHAIGRWYSAARPVPETWRWRWTFALIGAMTCLLGVGAVAVNVVDEATWWVTNGDPLITGVREAAPRTISVNNLKQIILATHGYHDVNKHLPQGGLFDANGRGMHGWQTFLLPYTDQGALFQRIDLKVAWNAPPNAAQMGTIISVYQHPSIEQQTVDGFGASHYAANVHVFGPAKKKMTLKDITDGTSNTLVAGEVSANFKPWGHPANFRDPALGLLTSPDGFGGPRHNVTNFAFADGTVRALRNDIDPRVLNALSTPRGGEPVDADNIER